MMLSIFITLFVLAIPGWCIWKASKMQKKLFLFSTEIWNNIDKLDNKSDARLLSSLFGYASISYKNIEILIDLALTIKYIVVSEEARIICDKINNYKL